MMWCMFKWSVHHIYHERSRLIIKTRLYGIPSILDVSAARLSWAKQGITRFDGNNWNSCQQTIDISILLVFLIDLNSMNWYMHSRVPYVFESGQLRQKQLKLVPLLRRAQPVWTTWQTQICIRTSCCWISMTHRGYILSWRYTAFGFEAVYQQLHGSASWYHPLTYPFFLEGRSPTCNQTRYPQNTAEFSPVPPLHPPGRVSSEALCEDGGLHGSAKWCYIFYYMGHLLHRIDMSIHFLIWFNVPRIHTHESIYTVPMHLAGMR